MDVPGRRHDDECAFTVSRPHGFDTPHPGKRPRKGLYPTIDREAALQKQLFHSIRGKTPGSNLAFRRKLAEAKSEL